MNVCLVMSTVKKNKIWFGVLSTENMAFEAQMVTVPKEH